MDTLVERLKYEHRLDASGYRALLASCDKGTFDLLRKNAAEVTARHFGRRVYIRGLIEVTNYCRNNCYYCGIRRDNRVVRRYRLTDDDILACCSGGHRLGFRTFVLQGGEDITFTDERLIPLVSRIHEQYPDCAITLSLGERTQESYKALYDAGATRYLLRHETASPDLYARLHPASMSWSKRIAAIEDLRQIGYQTGVGMMIGAPGQTIDHLVEDLLYIERIRPQMVGIGPFLSHSQTPLGGLPSGDLHTTLLMLSVIRLMLPTALMPATTALATLSPHAQLEGILSGANVIMPNLSPVGVRRNYEIYEQKAAFGSEAAEGLSLLARQLATIGYEICYDKGDFKKEVHL